MEEEMRDDYVQKIIEALEGANIKIARSALKQALCKLEENSFVIARTNSDSVEGNSD